MLIAATPKLLVLIILDGWGYAPASNANAISLARKPNYDRLLAEFPNTLIHQNEVDRVEARPPWGRAGCRIGRVRIKLERTFETDSLFRSRCFPTDD